MKILTINPGSTSTKIAVFEDEKNIFQKNLQHDADDLKQFAKITEQFEFRKEAILSLLKENNFDVQSFNAIVGRGGLMRPLASGTYLVNEAMKKDLSDCEYGEHASNLGALIADDIARQIPNCPAFIADPVVVDELQDVARIAGHPLFKRVSAFHALNQKAIAKAHAKKLGKPYESLNLIVAHLGGGISVGAHCQGKVIDVSNAIDGEGPFSPERSGTLPALQVAKLCFSGEYTFDQVKKILTGKGGMVAHLGTNQFQKIEGELIPSGDKQVDLVHQAMSYNIAKHIGAMATVLRGKVDAIILTGGIAWNPLMVERITEKISFLAPVAVYPGEDEMGALANNGLAVLRGETQTLTY
ncbi:MAG: butyrate kinase [Bacteroidales bacterium]|nr:butyrate kinase [Bacteroidales bacterium]MCL2133388.1 butyrate kinase [Bacteroidales bacterium]